VVRHLSAPFDHCCHSDASWSVPGCADGGGVRGGGHGGVPAAPTWACARTTRRSSPPSRSTRWTRRGDGGGAEGEGEGAEGEGRRRGKRLTFCVEGNISVGKSTLLRKVARELLLHEFVEVVPEPIEQWQDVGSGHVNVLQEFYDDPARVRVHVPELRLRHARHAVHEHARGAPAAAPHGAQHLQRPHGQSPAYPLASSSPSRGCWRRCSFLFPLTKNCRQCHHFC